ncbi:FMN phosphatase YigB (HAD superfamily) [Rhizomicrobium palustre]|uniref:FMN phosphatase YigB (HAD superfamily) n=1 Tax=Rhizomicrobium palustre TaxID=189966 RepID=A0A846N0R9_9PROT|nr:HAD family hydrolase [Rhizomicrobium palustre]NIK89296.1 FMN phosphatase YigB (HAD superfamily) [Rhizomicrobium palustre]
MSSNGELVFFFDVDNTLIDNDQITADLSAYLRREHGDYPHDCYWTIFEDLRRELGYADYLGALERYRVKYMHDPRILRMANWLIDYPFAQRLFPGAEAAVRHVGQWGVTAIISDGDAVFQPRKVYASGLSALFGRRVLIYVHKEVELAHVERLFPAAHYVFVDDKLRLLDAIKKYWGPKVTTIFPRQGHYATDMKILTDYPAADLSIDTIGDLVRYTKEDFLNASAR